MSSKAVATGVNQRRQHGQAKVAISSSGEYASLLLIIWFRSQSFPLFSVSYRDFLFPLPFIATSPFIMIPVFVQGGQLKDSG